MMKFESHNSTRTAPPRGFTLIELLVSVFIFAIVMTISMGTLIVLIDANQKAQDVQVVMSNLSFALDSMTRNIRTGRNYYCGNDTPSNSRFASGDEETNDCNAQNPGSIIFTDGETNERFGYRLNVDDGAIERRIAGGSWLPITSPELFVTNFVVTVFGSTESDIFQPQARIVVQGYIVSEGDTETDFTLQTTVTQRVLDY